MIWNNVLIRLPNNPSRRFKAAASLAVLTLALSGCMYPKERLGQNQVPAKDAVASVQMVVDLYQKDTGLLPMKNASENTPKYEKFIVDFAKLQQKNYISELPSASFEKGGSYYFVIQNEEKDPAVKLLPITTFQAVNDIQAESDRYKRNNGGAIPSGEQVYPGFYRINYAKLAVKEPELRSVYSGGALTLMMDERGRVYADYGSDLMRAVQKRGLDAIKPEEDLRVLLAEGTDFVPVKAPVYYLVNKEPVPQP
ncbi:hypothetical protein M3223_08495 [Paenibacillus pasadenensis]|uniref:hypothetical protein n=1 Tax=Paenibacillus pasadenensis TaxID=217090 RepID=UPI0020413CC9|nr:hypothetical protein [Paenibacillus pasadenensis]MCM3747393.1 hypothetical protein [Paenibacillus pasadenensis]